MPPLLRRPAIAKAICRATSEFLTLELVKNSLRASSNLKCSFFGAGTSIACVTLQIGADCSSRGGHVLYFNVWRKGMRKGIYKTPVGRIGGRPRMVRRASGAGPAGRYPIKSVRIGLLAGCVAVLFAGSAVATPIDYIFTGTGTGTLNGTAFSGSFTVTEVADTSGVTGPSGGEFINVASSATFVAGSLTATL